MANLTEAQRWLLQAAIGQYEAAMGIADTIDGKADANNPVFTGILTAPEVDAPLIVTEEVHPEDQTTDDGLDLTLSGGSTTDGELGGNLFLQPGTSSFSSTATLVIQDITFTAITAGPDGNNQTISYEEQVEDPIPLFIQQDESNTTVFLEPGPGYNTAAQIKAALDAFVISNPDTLQYTYQITGTGSDIQTPTGGAQPFTGGAFGETGIVQVLPSLYLPITGEGDPAGLIFSEEGSNVMQGFISAFSSADPDAGNMAFGVNDEGSPYVFVGYQIADGPNNTAPGPCGIFNIHLVAGNTETHDIGAISQPWRNLFSVRATIGNNAFPGGGIHIGPSLSGPASHTIQTNLANTSTTTAFATVATVDMAHADQAAGIQAIFVGRKTDGTKRAMFILAGLFSNEDGTVTQIGSTDVVASENSEDTSYAARFNISGTDVQLQAHGNGSANEIVNWQVTYQVTRSPFSN